MSSTQTFLARFWEEFRVLPDSEKRDAAITIIQSLKNDIVNTGIYGFDGYWERFVP